MTLPRGFKARAEREAERLRQEMGYRAADPVSVTALANHLRVKMVSADRLVDRARLEEIERLQAFAFSAATFKVGGHDVIVTNPLRTDGRLASDGAHELAHLLLKHELTELREIDGCFSAPVNPTRKSRPRPLAAPCCYLGPCSCRPRCAGRLRRRSPRRTA